MCDTDDATTMVAGEDGDFNFMWVCDNCGEFFKPTNKFERSTHCPNCGRQIARWVGADECE